LEIIAGEKVREPYDKKPSLRSASRATHNSAERRCSKGESGYVTDFTDIAPA